MSNKKWTPSQSDAINARNRSVIVSAAAGSGKTAVLVQRVVSRVTDTVSPTPIDRMLIVTFTKAAANEMRSRINAQLSREISLHPNSICLQRQQMLLPTADISTIDSFCSRLVRENFNVLGISPDFKMADNAQTDIMKLSAAEEVIERMYASNPAGFAALTDSLTSSKDDSLLTRIIIKLYDCVRAYPFPDEWLDQKLSMYDSAREDFAMEWLNIIKDCAADMLYDCAMCAIEALDCAQNSGEVYAAYSDTLQNDHDSLVELSRRVRNCPWQDVCGCTVGFNTLKRLKNDSSYEDIKSAVQDMRKIYKKQCQEACALLSYDTDAIRAQNYYIQPVISALFEAVRSFSQIYSAIKADRHICDFGDLVHLSLKLLVSRDDTGRIVPTQTAIQISNQYDEILIDEYQDTNLAQDTIFRAISKNEQNMFMVGDVKQSIYRFRQAMPQIFLNKLLSFDPYDQSDPNQKSAKILLDRNFRSRDQVTSAVNYIFSILMRRDFGKIEYDDSHSLKPGATYPDCGQYNAHVLLTDCGDAENANTDQRDIFEARSIGRKIQRMIDEGFLVTQDGVTRKCTYGDFCILLPTAKNKAYKYFDELSRQGIPVWTQGSDYLFDKIEVTQFIAYLKILDNPMQDIELITALHSPLFGFCDNELLKIRKYKKDVKLFNALTALSDSDEKCSDFLNTYRRHRDACTRMTVHQLINLIFEETNYPAIVRAAYSQTAADNLCLLLDYTKSFEKSGHKGLSQFLRYIRRIEQLDSPELSSASGISDDADVVRIMTIHKSKGLEFPICIIADLNRRFNKSSGADKLLFHPDMGVGIVSKDGQSLEEFRHIAWQAIRIISNSDDLSERLRLLYVAMTRAKEHLIFSICSGDIPELFSKSLRLLDNHGNGIPFRLSRADSFAQWILSCALRFKSAGAICDQYGVYPQFSDVDDSIQWTFESVRVQSVDEENKAQTQTAVIEPDEQLVDLIKSRLSYRYPYESELNVPAKITASQTAHGDDFMQYTAQRVPCFAKTDKLSPAQIGSALHLFLQYADLSKSEKSVVEQLELLKTAGKLTQAQAEAIDTAKIELFLHSSLFHLMQSADQVYREYVFTSQIPMSEVPQFPDSDACVTLQGTIDCLVIKDGKITVIDYKSDRVKDAGILSERYLIQLKLYKAAAERIFQLPVEHCYIYSIDKGQVIEI